MSHAAAFELTIRPASVDDAEGIVAILNPIIAAGCYTVFDTPLTAAEEREFIRSFPARGVFLVAERRDSGRIAGFQSLDPFATYTHAFDHVAVCGTFIDLASRRQGIGTRLAEAGFAAARAQGFEKVFTYVRADNVASLSFYLCLGFRIIGTAIGQARIDGRYIDEIIIEKRL